MSAFKKKSSFLFDIQILFCNIFGYLFHWDLLVKKNMAIFEHKMMDHAKWTGFGFVNPD